MLKLVTYKNQTVCGIRTADSEKPLYLVGTIGDLIAAELISTDHPSVKDRWLCIRPDDNIGMKKGFAYASLVDALRGVETETDDRFAWSDVSAKLTRMVCGRFSEYHLV